MTRTRRPQLHRPHGGVFAHFDLTDEIERLKTEPAWRDGDRNAITLTKRAALRLVLTALRRGAALSEHRAPAAMTLQVLSGRMVLRMADAHVELGPHDVVFLEAGVAHSADTLEDTDVLLTLHTSA